MKQMTFEEYQKKSRETAIYPNAGRDPVYPTLGLVGEAGEIANKIKKVLRDSGGKVNEDIKESIKDELGDVLWYIAQLASELNISLEDIAASNIEKLQSRKERGTLHGVGDYR